MLISIYFYINNLKFKILKDNILIKEKIMICNFGMSKKKRFRKTVSP